MADQGAHLLDAEVVVEGDQLIPTGQQGQQVRRRVGEAAAITAARLRAFDVMHGQIHALVGQPMALEPPHQLRRHPERQGGGGMGHQLQAPAAEGDGMHAAGDLQGCLAQVAQRLWQESG